MEGFKKEIIILEKEFRRIIKSLEMEKIGEKDDIEYYTYISKKTGQKILVIAHCYLDFNTDFIAEIEMNVLGDIIKIKKATDDENYILENDVKIKLLEDDIYKNDNNDDVRYRALIKDNKVYAFQELLRIEE